MSWQPELDDVERRRRLALELGGADKVARHKGQGKLTVRERIAGLVDAGSFEELGSIAGFPEYDARGQSHGPDAGQRDLRPGPHRRAQRVRHRR